MYQKNMRLIEEDYSCLPVDKRAVKKESHEIVKKYKNALK